MVQPINLIFRYLQNRSHIQVWLYEQVNMRIEGCIIGFDEYRNLVLDDAEEIHSKTKSRKQLGRIMLKGDNIVRDVVLKHVFILLCSPLCYYQMTINAVGLFLSK
uniref:Small nuclear ribonucleoprotein E n=1 Tax=Bos mutus grunniens TaxID=30521 RepID=A0A8B9XKX6_BOSMU